MSNKNTDKSSVKSSRLRHLKPWKPGQSGNPKGRPKGQRDYKTLYWIAIEKIANAQGTTPEEIEELMHGAAIAKAMRGDFFMYKDINDRVHGKPKDTIDLGSGGQSLAQLIVTAASNASGTRGRPKGSGKNQRGA